MTCHVAFSRGMNLGGRRITNDALRAAFEALGFTGVTTFRASGNVMYDAGLPSVSHIETGLRRLLGYEVPTMVRSAAQVAAIAGVDPFPGASGGKLQVTLLRDPPDAKARAGVLALATEDDRLTFSDRELFWLPRGGVSQSLLDWTAVERALGLGTTRTMGTIEAIARKCETPA